jgi:hypothetical protein
MRYCVRSGEGFRETKEVTGEKGKEAKASSKNLAWRNPAYRTMANPANKLANTTPRPYSWPNSNAIALAAATLFAVPVADDPNPVYAIVPVPVLEPVGLPVAPMVDVVDVELVRVGFWAPQG